MQPSSGPPYSDPDQLLRLYETESAPGHYPFAGPDFIDWRAQNKTLQDMSLHGWPHSMNLNTGAHPDNIYGVTTDANFFTLLGVPPLLGRTWIEGEDGRPEYCQPHIEPSNSIPSAACKRSKKPEPMCCLPRACRILPRCAGSCAALSKPFNFMVGIKGKSFSVPELAAAGVRRISLATSLYRAAMTGFLNAALEVRDQGKFEFLDRSVNTPELIKLMRV